MLNFLGLNLFHNLTVTLISNFSKNWHFCVIFIPQKYLLTFLISQQKEWVANMRNKTHVGRQMVLESTFLLKSVGYRPTKQDVSSLALFAGLLIYFKLACERTSILHKKGICCCVGYQVGSRVIRLVFWMSALSDYGSVN